MFQQTEADAQMRNDNTGVNEHVASQTEDLMLEHEALERRRVELD